jgi:hypothetical protein
MACCMSVKVFLEYQAAGQPTDESLLQMLAFLESLASEQTATDHATEQIPKPPSPLPMARYRAPEMARPSADRLRRSVFSPGWGDRE